MLLYIKLAWRNIFRNKRRTFIAGIAIGIGLAALIFTDATVIGMGDNMIESATASYLGEGQIHRAGYLDTHEIDQTIVRPDSVMARLRKQPKVAAFTPRVMSFAMISSPANMSAISLVGVQPSTERDLSQIDDAIIDGAYFEDDGNEREVIIGTKLAELLEVELGDRVVLTAAQAHTGDLAQEMFRISGIVLFNVDDIDKGMAFIRLGKAQTMLNLTGEIHEIALKFTDHNVARDENRPFWSKFSTDGNEAVGWPLLLPELSAALELTQFSAILVGFILFGVVALGIVNTLFMSLYERMYEFGVMRAVGTRPFVLGRLVFFEAGALAAISIVLGIILGFVVTAICAATGIDYIGIEFAGVTFRKLLYPVMTVSQFIYYPIAVFIFTSLISLYPALYAARLTPAEAMRKSL